jgi:hypothetical protein
MPENICWENASNSIIDFVQAAGAQAVRGLKNSMHHGRMIFGGFF